MYNVRERERRKIDYLISVMKNIPELGAEIVLMIETDFELILDDRDYKANYKGVQIEHIKEVLDVLMKM